MDKHYSIYKITCTTNGKVYIGQTSGSVKVRFQQHLQKDSNCIKLKRAIKKYGKENFIVEEIDITENKGKALQKEADYIKQYKSNNIRYGYNILAHGHSTYSTRKVYCIETKEIFETVQLAAKSIGVCPSFMANACKGDRPTVKGLHFTYLDKDNNPIMDKVRFIKPHGTKVRCIETGEVFNSVAEAARHIGRTDMTIFQCLKGKALRAGGYHWEYVEPHWYMKEVA